MYITCKMWDFECLQDVYKTSENALDDLPKQVPSVSFSNKGRYLNIYFKKHHPFVH